MNPADYDCTVFLVIMRPYHLTESDSEEKTGILPSGMLCLQELEVKRKERSQAVYERKKQLSKLRTKAEKVAEEKLGSQLDVLAPIKY